jgi:YbgC/YbaW family acyl-CoA thioester hydrolase
VVSHRERFRVGWVDTDASGRIHHTAAFRWVEATEVALFRTLGLLDAGVGRWPRRHVEAEYTQALAFDDVVEVCLNVASVGTSSVTFEWQITRDRESAVEGRHTAVQVDDDGQPLALSTEIRNVLLGDGSARATPGSKAVSV